MNWTDHYKQKTVSLEKAASVVCSGNCVYGGHGLAAPYPLLQALAECAHQLDDITVITLHSMGSHGLFSGGIPESFTINSVFFGKPERKAYAAHEHIDYTPVSLSQFGSLLRDGIINIDVATVQLSPPNEKGYMSFGMDVSYSLEAIRNAKIVIAEVNEQMPYTYGEVVHVDKIDHIVLTDRPIPELPRTSSNEVSQKIGAHAASLIPNQANLQIGFGAIPDSVLKSLGDRQDLGVHTELFTEGLVDLIEAGVITNRFNNLNPGYSVCTFTYGTKRVYDFLHQNFSVLMKSADYTNGILTASRVDNLISINAAVEVDLFGQVNAETLGGKQYSGIGGQVDFVRAAHESKGGKSIICLPSTAKNGTISRIVSQFSLGHIVTTSRNDVEYIVTEFGIAHLRGGTLNQRAKALIDIAHPNFREELTENWEKHINFKLSNKMFDRKCAGSNL